MMFLYTFGEPHSFHEIGTWNPENKLFGLSKKTGFFRVGEMWFTLNLLGMIVARLQELRKTGLGKYLADVFNVLDLIMLLNFAAVVMTRIVAVNTHDEEPLIDDDLLQTIEILMSIGGTFLWIRCLEVFSVHPEIGPLLEMIKKMFKDLATFLVILLLVIMGFAEAFYHLFAATDIVAYHDFSTTWLTLIVNLLGEELQYNAFDTQVYDSYMDPSPHDSYMDPSPHPPHLQSHSHISLHPPHPPSRTTDLLRRSARRC
jgi:hypothetical protein